MATATPPQVAPTTRATVTPVTPPISGLRLHRMSYETYEQIVEAGIFGPNDNFVLLDGLLVDKMSKNPPHSNALLRGLAAMQAACPPGWLVYPEQPVDLRAGPEGDSAPEPDLMVVFGDLERYERRHPVGTEVGLVIEIAASRAAVRIDRAGLARYAHAGIPIACIINLLDRSVEVSTEPSGPSDDPRYARSEVLRPGQVLAAAIGNATTGPAAIAPIPIESLFAPG